MMKKTLLAIALTAFGVTAAHAATVKAGYDRTVLTATVVGDVQLDLVGSAMSNIAGSYGNAFYRMYVKNPSNVTYSAGEWGLRYGYQSGNGEILENGNLKVCQQKAADKCVEIAGNPGNDLQLASIDKNGGWINYIGTTELSATTGESFTITLSQAGAAKTEPGKYPIVAEAVTYSN